MTGVRAPFPADVVKAMFLGYNAFTVFASECYDL